MASRSTRNKVKFQADKALRKTERIQEHLKYIDDLGKQQSPFINEAMPVLVGVAELLKNMLVKFRAGL